jgi:hypothetical protein
MQCKDSLAMRTGAGNLGVKRRSPRQGEAVGAVRRARRRLILNDALSEGANLASFCLFLVILILIAGSEVIDWRVAAMAAMAGVGFAFRRAWRRAPTDYLAAQIVDKRMGLADTLSSAAFVRTSEAGPRLFHQTVLDQAERAAASTDVRRAVPYSAPRGAYATMALFLIASSLFAWRYASTGQLTLRRPIARLGGFGRPAADPVVEAKAQRPESPLDPMRGADSINRNMAPDHRRQTSGADREAEQGRREDGDSKKTSPSQASRSSDNGQTQQQQQTEEERRQRAESRQGMAQDGRQGGERRSGENAGNNGSDQGRSAGLLSKFRDAVRSLVSKMSPQNGSNQGSQSGQNNAGNGQNQSEQAASRKNDGADAAGGGKGEADREGKEQTQSASGAGKSVGGQPQSSRQPASGMGSEDGNKEMKDAERTAAMGKLSEIFGKRASGITGEATIQVDSGRQSLSTPYGQQGGGRPTGSAEIGRDEVPIALQPYVQRYFEQVRNPRNK